MQIHSLKTKVLELNCDLKMALMQVLSQYALPLKDGDILVVASKIVALSQGRQVANENLDKLVKMEADWLSPHNQWLTIKDGIFIANAGIDESNVPAGQVVLWPEDSYAWAEEFCQNLKKEFGLQDLGIIVCDSQCTPLRRGVTGVALGYAGFVGVEDLRGERDLYGRKLVHTTRNLADSLSSAALLVMGEAAECTPMALIKGAPVKFSNDQVNPSDVKIDPEKDLFSGLMSF